MSRFQTKAAVIQKLGDVGLSPLEAETYLVLLETSPLTAHAVGLSLGATAESTDSVLNSLVEHGAVTAEGADPRVFRANLPKDFLARKRRSMSSRAQTAEAALSSLGEQHFDERVFRAGDLEEVLDRYNEMIDSATSFLAIDAFPRALSRIARSAMLAAERGVEVRVHAYREVTMPGCDVVVCPTADEYMNIWGAEQLNVVVDGREVLVALLSATLDRVHQAIWSQSLYLSCRVHAGLISGHSLMRVAREAAQEPEDSAARQALASHRFLVDGGVPGQLELFQRFLRADSS